MGGAKEAADLRRDVHRRSFRGERSLERRRFHVNQTSTEVKSVVDDWHVVTVMIRVDRVMRRDGTVEATHVFLSAICKTCTGYPRRPRPVISHLLSTSCTRLTRFPASFPPSQHRPRLSRWQFLHYSSVSVPLPGRCPRDRRHFLLPLPLGRRDSTAHHHLRSYSLRKPSISCLCPFSLRSARTCTRYRPLGGYTDCTADSRRTLACVNDTDSS